MNHHFKPLRTALGLALALSLCGPLPVALAALAGPDAPAATMLPGSSLYQVDAGLTDQHGQPLRWSDLHGRPQLVSMFYANCHLMCPLILENAKALQKQLGADGERLGVAVITLDPARDTPQARAAVAADHRTPAAWRYLRPEPDAVRALASVLGVRYRFRDDGSINHTSVLVLLDAEGREVARSEVTGIAPDPAFVQQVRATLAAD
ncbi:SCO family protein [Pseudoxanthomonas taiwanensis]|uniref:SCO family protein n=1 Tax=Pseudoxanthomonas taiwanensis TaxID=176598 RepID=A0A921TEJ7_9GAMM|nr:SCO family protein [Pseudoxanthomonas taiwanensis]KAF1689863.1 SCO family protein [Pseudoxanthomonas taiwanensis]